MSKKRLTNPDQQTLLWSLQPPVNHDNNDSSSVDTPTMTDFTHRRSQGISEVPTLVGTDASTIISSPIKQAEVLAERRYCVLGILKGGMGEV